MKLSQQWWRYILNTTICNLLWPFLSRSFYFLTSVRCCGSVFYSTVQNVRIYDPSPSVIGILDEGLYFIFLFHMIFNAAFLFRSGSHSSGFQSTWLECRRQGSNPSQMDCDTPYLFIFNQSSLGEAEVEFDCGLTQYWLNNMIFSPEMFWILVNSFHNCAFYTQWNLTHLHI